MIGGLTYVPLSDIGVQREENQDYQGHDLTPQGFLFIVADGMGGHAGGATASQMAVNHTRRAFSVMEPDKPVGALKDSIQIANRAVWSMAAQRPELHGMGSTIVALLVQERCAYIAHVGDSRIYLLRDHKLHQLTKDHTMVQRLVDEGVIAPEQAEHHQKSHILNRSLGGKNWVEVDAREEPIELQEGDIFLLCSDGLTGLVDDDEIGRILVHTELHQAARILVDEANARGGFDNTTIALVRIDSLPLDVRVRSSYPPPEMFEPPVKPTPKAEEPEALDGSEPEPEPDEATSEVEEAEEGAAEPSDDAADVSEEDASEEDAADDSEASKEDPRGWFQGDEPVAGEGDEEASSDAAPDEASEEAEDAKQSDEGGSVPDEGVEAPEEGAEALEGDEAAAADEADVSEDPSDSGDGEEELDESPLVGRLPPQVSSEPIDDDGVGSYRVTKLREGMPALLYTRPSFPRLTEPEPPPAMSTGTMLLILVMGLSAGLLLGFVLAQTLNKAPMP
ncbi:MAG: hypothetical protein CMH57_13725 [Myxococcales bacterium]|nr:hypothetical protein [Myxococcales bacterium]